ncbi:cell division control protein 48 b-like [Trifolium pratense]|uniref:Cell division control protein 48 b-like n=1 Tax=Trifolium pratense TaxID=57577 RepID=A0A2K3K4A0_TRIPR|nr:cell division control protein 48 b-like [Trifolium pratense]
MLNTFTWVRTWDLAIVCRSLVRAVVEECGANLTIISPDTVYSTNAGESERTLREAFSEASSHTALGKSSVIFIDEIDTLCPPRNSKYVTIHEFYAE